jgi:hypothetical protein
MNAYGEDTWRVRIQDVSGNTHGAGVLLSGYQVLTRARVVAAALHAEGQDTSTADQKHAPEGEVRIDFTARGLSRGRWRAWVGPGGWFPPRDDTAGDIAVLEIAGSLPYGLMPARLRLCGEPGNRDVRIYGYPPGSPEMQADAKLVASHGPPGLASVMINGEELTRSRRGFDGAGVVDVRSGEVLGCLMETVSPRYGLARMMPTEVICRLLPALQEQLTRLRRTDGYGSSPGLESTTRPYDRSWLSPDQREVKRLLLATLGRWKIETLRLVADRLNSLFAGYLHVPDYRTEITLYNSLFAACLEQPGALSMLFQMLEHASGRTLRQDDPEFSKLREKIQKVDPQPLLTLEQRNELYGLLDDVGFAEAADAYADAIGPTGGQLPPYASDPITIARILEAANRPQNGLPPMVRFAEELANRLSRSQVGLAERIRAWTDRYVAQNARDGNLDGEVRQVRSRASATSEAVPRGRPTLLLYLREALAPGGFRAEAKLQRVPAPTRNLQADDTPYPLASLPFVVDKLLNEVRQPSAPFGTGPLIEFVVPRPLAGLDFDGWLVGGVLPRRLGVSMPVIVRSMERAGDDQLHRLWQAKWSWIKSNSDRPTPMAVHWLWNSGSPLDILTVSLARTPPASLALGFQVPGAREFGPDDEVSVAIRAGIPIVIWAREPHDNGDFDKLKDLFNNYALTEFPDRIWELRSAGGSLLERDITIIYDDADRIPDSVPNRDGT